MVISMTLFQILDSLSNHFIISSYIVSATANDFRDARPDDPLRPELVSESIPLPSVSTIIEAAVKSSLETMSDTVTNENRRAISALVKRVLAEDKSSADILAKELERYVLSGMAKVNENKMA